MYYYFEIESTPDNFYNCLQENYKFNIKQFINFNKLVLKPRTNSVGVFGSGHYHSKMNADNEYLPYKFIDQTWVDLNKYERGYEPAIDYFIDNIIPIINAKEDIQRETIIENKIELANRIINKIYDNYLNIDFILTYVLNLTLEEIQLYKSVNKIYTL